MAEWDYCLELSKQPQLPGEGLGEGSQGKSQGSALAKHCGGRAELEDVKLPRGGGSAGRYPGDPGEVSDPCPGQDSTQSEGEFGVRDHPPRLFVPLIARA